MKNLQLLLNRAPIRQSKYFLRALAQIRDFEESERQRTVTLFQILDGTQFAQKADPTMTLEKYCALPWTRRHVRLQIGTHTPEAIVYAAFITQKERTHLAEFICALTEKNYDALAHLFKEAYKTEIDAWHPSWETQTSPGISFINPLPLKRTWRVHQDTSTFTVISTSAKNYRK